MHIKRNSMPKIWPIARKSKKSRYIAVASHSKSSSIPLLFIVRDILKIANTRKEARHLILNGDVKINCRIRKDEKFPVQVFDIIAFGKTGKNYRLEIVNGKFNLKEHKEEEKKIVKILGKKVLGRGVIQINLEDGRNFITKEKFNLGDSALIDLNKNKIEKIIPLKENSSVQIISGKHSGERGKLKAIEQLKREKRFIIKLENKEVKLPAKTILVIE